LRSGAVLSTQDVIEGKTTLQVNQQLGVDFQFTSTEMTLNVTDLTQRVIKPAMSIMVNGMANDILTEMYRSTYNWVGTPGTRITTYAGFSKGPERLDELSVPGADRNSVLCPNDQWGLLGGQVGLYITNAAQDAYRQGTLGEIGGV